MGGGLSPPTHPLSVSQPGWGEVRTVPLFFRSSSLLSVESALLCHLGAQGAGLGQAEPGCGMAWLGFFEPVAVRDQDSNLEEFLHLRVETRKMRLYHAYMVTKQQEFFWALKKPRHLINILQFLILLLGLYVSSFVLTFAPRTGSLYEVSLCPALSPLG